MVRAAVEVPPLKIDPELASFLPVLTGEQIKQLEANLIADGKCTSKIVVWKSQNTIVDGHHRYPLCCKHNIPHQIEFKEFSSRAEAMDWMLRHQEGRRNWTEEQKRYSLGKLYAEQKKNTGKPAKSNSETVSELTITSERLAAEHGVSERTVRNAGDYAEAVDAVGQKAPDLKAAILQHEAKATDADVKQLAEMPKAQVKRVAKAVASGEVKSVGKAIEQVTAAAPSKNGHSKKDQWEGGAEPKEAIGPLGKLEKALKAAVRAKDDVQTIIGQHKHLDSLLAGLDQANRSLVALRTELKRKK